MQKRKKGYNISANLRFQTQKPEVHTSSRCGGVDINPNTAAKKHFNAHRSNRKKTTQLTPPKTSKPENLLFISSSSARVRVWTTLGEATAKLFSEKIHLAKSIKPPATTWCKIVEGLNAVGDHDVVSNP